MAVVAEFVLNKSKLTTTLRKIMEEAPAKMGSALEKFGDVVLLDAQNNYVPVDFGVLKGSGLRHPFEQRGKDIAVKITFGGAASEYALAVHEHPSEHSPPSWYMRDEEGNVLGLKGWTSSDTREAPLPTHVTFHPGGHGPKYLERPFYAQSETLVEQLIIYLNQERLLEP